jgi:hypothetical protein
MKTDIWKVVFKEGGRWNWLMKIFSEFLNTLVNHHCTPTNESNDSISFCIKYFGSNAGLE